MSRPVRPKEVFEQIALNILTDYQARRSGWPPMKRGAQEYCNWRTAWLMECLKHLTYPCFSGDPAILRAVAAIQDADRAPYRGAK